MSRHKDIALGGIVKFCQARADNHPDDWMCLFNKSRTYHESADTDGETTPGMARA